MSKSKNKKEIVEPKSPPKAVSMAREWPDISILFIFLYLLIEFVPVFQSIDVIGPQWLALTILNIFTTIFIFVRRTNYSNIIKGILNSYTSIVYFFLLIWALLSYFYAVNSIEVLVNAARIINTVIAFINLAILLCGNKENFKHSFYIITFILFFQSISILKQFYDGFTDGVNFDGLVYGLKGNAGNKNIMAAILAIKIPFALYTVYEGKRVLKIVGSISMLVAIFAIFIINARTAYLSIFGAAFLYLIFLIINVLSQPKSRKSLLISALFILIPLVIAFFLAQVIVSNARETSGNVFGTYGTVTERMKTIYDEATNASGNTRIGFWGHAVDYIKHHPLFGGGLGNWKLASIPYVKELTNDLIVPYHAHNDFLEITADLGLPGGILFLSLFILMIYYTCKIWRVQRGNIEYVAIFSLIGLSVYFFDAFLNFPAERPATQILFAFILASITGIFITGKPHLMLNRFWVHPILYLSIAMLFLVPCSYITYLTYKSMRAQRILSKDINAGNPTASFSVASQIFPSIPNITVTTLPIAAIKSRYYNRDERFEKSLELLDEAAKANPYLYYSEFLRGAFYFVKGETDSAYKYTKISFYNWPRAANYFRNYMAVLGLQKDTTEMKNAFMTYVKYRNEPFAWNTYITGILQSKRKGDDALLKLVDSALSLFPNNPDLLQRKAEIMGTLPYSSNGIKSISQLESVTKKLFDEGMMLFQKKSYSRAAEKFTTAASYVPTNYAYFENAGICYYANNEFKKAIKYLNKSIALGTSNTGKSEYFKGICLINLGKREEGCAMVQLAKAKNYPDADPFLKANCK